MKGCGNMKGGLKKTLTCSFCFTMALGTLSFPEVKADQKQTDSMDYVNRLEELKPNLQSNEGSFSSSNLALGKTVNVSGLEVEGKWTGDLMVDGDKDSSDSRWSSGLMRTDMSVTEQQTPQWAIIDLQAPKSQISQITIFYHLLVWGTEYEIQTSSTLHGEWRTLETIKKEPSGDRNPVHTITKEMEADRYVRFYFKKMNTNAVGKAISIKEIEINGKQLVSGNLAYQKTTKVSGLEVDGKWTGDKAVDGNHEDNDSRWSSGVMRGDMSITAQQTPQWIVIDLQSEMSLIDSIDLYYYQLVWGTNYEIQTAKTLQGEWRTIDTISKDAGNDRNPVEHITKSMIADRYVRLYFHKMNTNALGNALSIREIEIQGTQEFVPDLTPANSAKDIIKGITQLNVDINDQQLSLPTVPENYELVVKGSDVENVIRNDGTITSYNIGDRDVDVLLSVTNKEDAEDYAEKNVTVHIPDKASLYPDVYPQVEHANAKPDVLPALQEWYGYEGAFQLTEETILYVNDQKELQLMDVAQSMQADIEDITGLHVTIKQTNDEADVRANDIYMASLAEDSYQVGNEGYMTITNDLGMKIYSPTYTGALYGSVTALQILSQNSETLTIPYGVIRDYPKYEVRGIMLDIARVPYRMQLLKDVSKYLSWFKMNELHLHINDDFGAGSGEGMFRLQSEQFPGLKTTFKTGTSAYDYFNNIYGEPHYTKDEYVGLQDLASDYGVNIVTEIDSPGHAKSFNDYAKTNPDHLDWLGPDQLTLNPRSEQLLDLVGNNAERANRLITSLFDEFTSGDHPMFVGDIVHIGADEYWNANAAEKEALRKYIVDLYDVLDKNGKTVRMWGQMKAYPGVTEIPNDIQLDLWHTGYEDVKARLKDGYKVINIDEGYMYGNSGRNRRDVMNIEYVYENWDPTVFNGLKVNKGEPNLIGGKTALWGDENRQGVIEKDLQDRIVRQLAVTSEKTWGGTTKEDTYDKYEYKFARVKDCPNTEIAMHVDTKSSLIAAYDMDHIKDNTLYDVSGNAYNAVVKGGNIVKEDDTTYLKFDANTVIETPLKTISYPYTVSFDVKVDSDIKNTKDASLFSGYDGRLQAAGVNGELSINRVMYEQKFNYTLSNEKSHIDIVGTYEGTKIYVNGKLHKFLHRVSNTSNLYQPENLLSSFVFPLEKIGDGFQGYLGNIKVYNKALSSEVIANDDHSDIINVAQNVASAQDTQNINEGSWDEEAKKINVAWKAFDGDGRDLTGQFKDVSSETDSRWVGGTHETAWLSGDLGEERKVSSVRIQWNAPGYAKAFNIQTSTDNIEWKDAYVVNDNTDDLSNITFDEPISCRYIRMQGVQKNGNNKYSIQEFEVFEQVDKTELSTVLDRAADIVNDKKLEIGSIEQTYEAFFHAYTFATALEASPLATISEVQEALTALQNEMDALETDVDKSALEDVLQKAKDAIDRDIYADVSVESAQAFQLLYDTSLTLFNDIEAQQEAIDAVTKELQTALDQLVLEQVRTQLRNQITEYQHIDITRYEDNEARAQFVAYLQASSELLEDPTLTYEDITICMNQLKELKGKLTLKENTALSKMMLNNAIQKANVIIEHESFQLLAPKVQRVIRNAYEHAIAVYEDHNAPQTECMQAWLRLADAMQLQDFKADKKALSDIITLYADLDDTQYTQESVAIFNVAYEKAVVVNNDENALQERIDDTYKNLMNAIEGLVKKGHVDKTALELMIATIEDHVNDTSIYKQDANWTALQHALQYAKSILANEDATLAQVHNAMMALANAYENIRLIPNESQLNLMNTFVQVVLNMNRSLFTSDELVMIDDIHKQTNQMLRDFDSKTFAVLQQRIEEVTILIDEKTNPDLMRVDKPNETDKTKDTINTQTSAIPKTNDSTNTVAFALMLCASGYALYENRKRKHKK